MSLERLVDLVKLTTKSFEFYNVLKRTSSYIGIKEFTTDLLEKFKINLTNKYEIIVSNDEHYDLIILPYLLPILKTLFFGKIKEPIEKKKKEKFKVLESLSKEESLLYLKIFISSITLLNNLIKLYTSNNKEIKIKDKENKSKPTLPPKVLSKNTKQVDNKIYSVLIFKVLAFLSSYFEEFLMITIEADTFNSFNYFTELLVKNNLNLILMKLVVIFPSEHACALPSITILNKIISIKKEQKEVMANFLKTEDIKSGFKSLFANLYDNSKYFNIYLTFLSNFLDLIPVADLISIFNFKLCNIVFSQYKTGGLEPIHENIINYIKTLLMKKISLPEKEAIVLFTDETFSEMVHIFTNALILILKKIKLMDNLKLCKWLFQCLTHLNTITAILTNINPTNSAIVHKICAERRVPECIIELLSQLNEKKVIINISTVFDKTDLNLLTTKALLFRTLFHCVNLVTFFHSYDIKTIPKLSAEKFYKVIKSIEDNDDKFSPKDIAMVFENVSIIVILIIIRVKS